MNILIKNVKDTLGHTEVELAGVLSQTNLAFQFCEVKFLAAEAEVEAKVPAIEAELLVAWHKVKHALGLEHDAPPAVVVAAATDHANALADIGAALNVPAEPGGRAADNAAVVAAAEAVAQPTGNTAVIS